MTGMLPFHAAEPELARQQLLTLVALTPRGPLPADTYVFVENYCAVRGCDCRRVLFTVLSGTTRKALATLHHYLDEAAAHGQPQTSLAQGQAQTPVAPALCDALVRDVLDARTRARLEDHYARFKAALLDPSHRVQLSLPREERLIQQPSRLPPRVNRNDPCPCGSGRKYKKCHGAAAE